MADLTQGLPYPGFQPSFDTCTGVSWYCPVSITTYGDYFNVGACAFFVAWYSILLIAQTHSGIRGRTWTFMVFLLIGTVFELWGYAARLVMRPNGPGGSVWSYEAFVMQLLFLILGPTFVAAAISVTFKWIVIHCGERYSVMKPRWYPWIFLGTDFFSIIIQAAGGGVSAAATNGDQVNHALLDAGNGLLIAGTAFQAANMVFCGMLIVIFMWRYIKAAGRGEVPVHQHPTSTPFNENEVGNGHQTGAGTPTSGQSASPTLNAHGTMGTGEKRSAWEMVKPSTGFRMFLWALAVAYVAIIVRCIYRIPEMASGWGSRLMQTEYLFLIFDGGAVAFAVTVLVIFHPTYFFPIMSKGSKRIAPHAVAEKEKEKAAGGAGVEAGSPAAV